MLGHRIQDRLRLDVQRPVLAKLLGCLPTLLQKRVVTQILEALLLLLVDWHLLVHRGRRLLRVGVRDHEVDLRPHVLNEVRRFLV